MTLRADMGQGGDQPPFEVGQEVQIISAPDPEIVGQTGTVQSAACGWYYAVDVDGMVHYLPDASLGGERPAGNAPPEPPPPDAPPAAPPAAAIARAGGTSIAGQIEVTQLAALGRWVLDQTKATNAERAKGRVLAALQAADKLPGVSAELAKVKGAQESGTREKLVADAVAAGKLTPGQAYEWAERRDDKGALVLGADQKPERIRALRAFLRAPYKGADGRAHGQSLEQLEAYLADLPALGAHLAEEKRADVERAADADLEARAAAAGMSVDDYRTSLANVERGMTKES